MTENLLTPGALVADRYRVHRILATGGMGAIYEATHEILDQRVALKLLLPGVAHDAELVERFVREAKIAAKLKSDHVVRMFDVGKHDGAPYIAMELLEGEDLGSLVERGPLSVRDAVRYMLEALDGILEAHENGVVHRDLKPSNLFLARTKNGSIRVKVLDFGISKLEVAESELQLTSSRSMMGSPAYMSPEQVRSTRNVTAQTDVWAIGVILWELLTGRIAFNGETVGDVFAKIREEPLPLVTELRPDVPAELAAVIACAAERLRSRRYATARDLYDALLPFADHEGPSPPRFTFRPRARDAATPTAVTVVADPDRPPSGSTIRTGVSEQPATSSSAKPAGANPRFLAIGVGSLIASGIALAVLATQRDAPSSSFALSASADAASSTAEPPASPIVTADPSPAREPSAPASSSAPTDEKTARATSDATAARPGGPRTAKPKASTMTPPAARSTTDWGF